MKEIDLLISECMDLMDEIQENNNLKERDKEVLSVLIKNTNLIIDDLVYSINEVQEIIYKDLEEYHLDRIKKNIEILEESLDKMNVLYSVAKNKEISLMKFIMDGKLNK